MSLNSEWFAKYLQAAAAACWVSLNIFKINFTLINSIFFYLDKSFLSGYISLVRFYKKNKAFPLVEIEYISYYTIYTY